MTDHKRRDCCDCVALVDAYLRRTTGGTVWLLHDPQSGQSVWARYEDAVQVARDRRACCTVTERQAEPGDLVSTLGAPDYRVRA